jgi:hypothetical protein
MSYGKGISVTMSLTLYTSPGCHLCEQAEEILDYLGVSFSAIDISSDVNLVRKYGVRIPVVQREDGAELGWPFDSLDVERFAA